MPITLASDHLEALITFIWFLFLTAILLIRFQAQWTQWNLMLFSIYQHLFGKQTHLTVEMFWKQIETIPPTPNKSNQMPEFHFTLCLGNIWT